MVSKPGEAVQDPSQTAGLVEKFACDPAGITVHPRSNAVRSAAEIDLCMSPPSRAAHASSGLCRESPRSQEGTCFWPVPHVRMETKGESGIYSKP